MRITDPTTPWTDPGWIEKPDNAWQRGLRLLQGWWRQEVAKLPAGPPSATSSEGFVVSMLPLDVSDDINLMTPEARRALDRAREDLKGRPGMIQPDRMNRNLLSSQPLAFNVFGYLAEHREALLPWVRGIDTEAITVDDVRLEWAPSAGTIGGSAFDAIVDYSTAAGLRGFVGVECKYHENLRATLTGPAAEKWHDATADAWWKPGAGAALDSTGLRQFWFNQLLTQRTVEHGGFDRGFGVVVACADDASAATATESVAAQLHDSDQLSFRSLETLIASVEGHREWRNDVTRRYVDFAPVVEHLPPNDPRR